MSLAEAAEPIVMPFDMLTWLGTGPASRNHVLDGVQIPKRRDNSEGKSGKDLEKGVVKVTQGPYQCDRSVERT